MKRKTLYTVLAVLFLLPFTAGAQQALRGSYFSEYSTQRNKLNPAFTPRSNYLGFLVLDNLGISIGSNLAISDFLYPLDNGKTGTALHPDVPAETFLGNLPSYPQFNLDFDTDILNIGFFTGRNTFWTICLGLRADAEFDIPKDFFTFLKLGAQNDPQSYSMKDLNLIANVYAEASLGVSYDFSDLVQGLRAGLRAKFLASVARADIRVNTLDLTMGSDAWNVKTDATAYLMMKGLEVGRDADDKFYTNFDTSSLGLAGMGAAFDFGVEYRLPINDFFDSIRFSASVTDLGFINYNKAAVQQFKSAGEFTFTGLEGITMDDSYDYDKAFQDIADEAMALANLEKVENPGATTLRMRPNLYVGVEMPFLWNRMSLGLLYNAKFGYASTMNELTLAYNLRPGKWINLGVNYSMLNAARSIGWLLELTPRSGINFFIGSDYMFLRMANLKMESMNIPFFADEINFNLRFGFSLALGNKYDDKGVARREARAERRNK